MRGEHGLPPTAVELIAHRDTIFIVSQHAQLAPGGADVSHRGGKPGFVHVDACGALAWVDSQGNIFFNAVRNLLAGARRPAVLRFRTRPPAASERALASAMGGMEVAHCQGAKRMLRFVTERYVYPCSVLPRHWTLSEYTPAVCRYRRLGLSRWLTHIFCGQLCGQVRKMLASH